MHTTKKLLLAVAAGSMSIAGGALANGAPDPTMSFVYRMSLDAGGKITALDYTGKDGNDNPVASKLAALIRTWDFVPGKVDGVPTPTDTTLTVRAALRKSSSESVELGIIGAGTGAVLEKGAAPAYPSQELANGIQARLIAQVAVGADGRAEKVEIRDTSPMSRSDRKAFESAVVQASKEMRFRPERVGGNAVAARFSYSIDFCVTPMTPCEKVKDEALLGDGTVPKSVPVALDSQVTLVTKVAGTTL